MAEGCCVNGDRETPTASTSQHFFPEAAVRFYARYFELQLETLDFWCCTDFFFACRTLEVMYPLKVVTRSVCHYHPMMERLAGMRLEE